MRIQRYGQYTFVGKKAQQGAEARNRAGFKPARVGSAVIKEAALPLLL
jgi:hypothetical protein